MTMKHRWEILFKVAWVFSPDRMCVLGVKSWLWCATAMPEIFHSLHVVWLHALCVQCSAFPRKKNTVISRSSSRTSTWTKLYYLNNVLLFSDISVNLMFNRYSNGGECTGISRCLVKYSKHSSVFLDGWTEHLIVSFVRSPTNGIWSSGFVIISTFQIPTPWGWQTYAETCWDRIWNLLIIKSPILPWTFVGLLTYSLGWYYAIRETSLVFRCSANCIETDVAKTIRINHIRVLWNW
jgi:hypothetical protein